MLLYFILGCLFIFIGIPLLQSLISLVSAAVEYEVYKFAIKIAKLKKEISDLKEEDQEEEEDYPIGFQQTQAIGTEYESEEQDLE